MVDIQEIKKITEQKKVHNLPLNKLVRYIDEHITRVANDGHEAIVLDLSRYTPSVLQEVNALYTKNGFTVIGNDKTFEFRWE